MKKLFTPLVFALAASMCLTSCDKDDTTPEKTKTELISLSEWKFSSATYGGADATVFLEDCQMDNTMIFAAAGTGTVDEETQKCDPADPQTASFTWNFASGETELFVSNPLFDGGSSTFTLVSLTETQLVVSQPFTFGPITQPLVVTFVH